jgi:hypothetical protein
MELLALALHGGVGAGAVTSGVGSSGARGSIVEAPVALEQLLVRAGDERVQRRHPVRAAQLRRLAPDFHGAREVRDCGGGEGEGAILRGGEVMSGMQIARGGEWGARERERASERERRAERRRKAGLVSQAPRESRVHTSPRGVVIMGVWGWWARMDGLHPLWVGCIPGWMCPGTMT